MPNWCDNTVVITGAKENIRDIKGMIDAISQPCDIGLFEKLTPISEEADNHTEWGTKWDVNVYHDVNYSAEFDDEAGTGKITLCFSSAWSPPVGFCAKLMNAYDVKVRCSFIEPGVDFIGFWDCGEHQERCMSDEVERAKAGDKSAIDFIQDVSEQTLAEFLESWYPDDELMDWNAVEERCVGPVQQVEPAVEDKSTLLQALENVETLNSSVIKHLENDKLKAMLEERGIDTDLVTEVLTSRLAMFREFIGAATDIENLLKVKDDEKEQ